MEVLEDPRWHVVRIATGLLLLGLLAGCASTYDAPVDAGSPFPPWCADIARRHAEMPAPRDGRKSDVRLPPECTEATNAPLFPPRKPAPVPEG
jgi:hypothetical protein